MNRHDQAFASRIRYSPLVIYARVGMLALLAVAPVSAQQILRVDASVVGGAQDGSSWVNAYTHLQDALDQAWVNSSVQQVWVAAGTYLPDQGAGITPGDREASFELRDGLALYGGFNGTESTADARDPAANVTILSGDLNGDDATLGNSENTYRILDGSNADATGVLDGFTIEAGAADLTSLSLGQVGGGMYLSGGGPTVIRCIFRDCYASDAGAAVFAIEASPTFIDCVFADNLSPARGFTGGGAVLCSYGASVTFHSCVFLRNTADYGGAVDVWHGGAYFTNCTFIENHAYISGGAVECSYQPGDPPEAANAALVNCVAWDNTAASSGSQLAHLLGELTIFGVSHSNIDGGLVGVDASGGGMLDWIAASNIDANPLFADAAGRLSPASPCIDVGDNGSVIAATDLDGLARIVDGGSGSAIVDMGAYEYQAQCGSGPPGGSTPMDWDADGDVDLVDYEAFFGCLGGPITEFQAGCIVFDLDGDCDVDLVDYEQFQAAFSAITQDPPALCMSPSVLSFGTSTTNLTFTVWNCGEGQLSYTIAGDATWLSLLPASGDSVGEFDSISVTVDRTGLADGDYQGLITVTPSVGTPQTLIVTMTVGGSGAGGAILASRTSGVAPLAVFFDAVDPASGVNQPATGDHADQHYLWDFGDPTSGTWSTDGQSRNQAIGYVAAHVFENPGTYTVTLQVTEPSGQIHLYQQDVNVEDPATAPGWTTYYVAANGSNTNNGLTPQTPFKTFAKGMTKASTKKRILFRRGDTFSTSTAASIISSGPGIVGAYGDPGAARPVITRTGSNDIFGLRGRDWRIMDLELNGDNSGSGEGVDAGSAAHIESLLLRLHIHGFYMAAWNTYFPQPIVHDHDFVVDCEFNNQFNKGVFMGGTRLAFLGNSIHNTKSHILRVWHGLKCVISHNDLRDPVNSTAAVIKYHNSIKVSSGLPDGQYAVISDNWLRGHTWALTIGTQDEFSNEVVRNAVLERNFVEASPTTIIGLRISAQDVTLRNNMGNLSNTPWDARLMSITRWGVEPPPTGARVYNNNVYRSDSGGVRLLDVTRSDTLIYNNIAYSPSGGAVIGGTSGTFGANLTQNPFWVNPGADDFRLQSGSPAIDAGVTAPVLDDWEGTSRPINGNGTGGAEFDIGAYEFSP